MVRTGCGEGSARHLGACGALVAAVATGALGVSGADVITTVAGGNPGFAGDGG
jgi:hypothetical protein